MDVHTNALRHKYRGLLLEISTNPGTSLNNLSRRTGIEKRNLRHAVIELWAARIIIIRYTDRGHMMISIQEVGL